jgi:hypothetical protein
MVVPGIRRIGWLPAEAARGAAELRRCLAGAGGDRQSCTGTFDRNTCAGSQARLIARSRASRSAE